MSNHDRRVTIINTEHTECTSQKIKVHCIGKELQEAALQMEAKTEASKKAARVEKPRLWLASAMDKQKDCASWAIAADCRNS
jgi:hypothetical protein